MNDKISNALYNIRKELDIIGFCIIFLVIIMGFQTCVILDIRNEYCKQITISEEVNNGK
jgi:hypothetical protein